MQIDDVDMVEEIEALRDQLEDFERLKDDIRQFLVMVRDEADYLLRKGLK